ncbi:MAG: hypothetical protein HYY46_00335 [Deltaproteobacteria bacterium]|nr:hypothetical protein [Deltaproteobacteria bacterium]
MQIQICRGFTDIQWKELRKRLAQNGAAGYDEDAWRCAVEVFERRIRERFLSCIEALQRDDAKSDITVNDGAPADCPTLPKDDGRDVVVPGFAIMALCCLLIETLQSFRESRRTPSQVTEPCNYPKGDCIRPQASTTDAFKKFLQLPAFKGEFVNDNVAKRFVRGVRNGILHEAETRRWVIWREEPKGRIIEPEARGYAVNRTAFYKAVKTEFNNYLRELLDPGKTALRSRFLKKMNDIAKEC